MLHTPSRSRLTVLLAGLSWLLATAAPLRAQDRCERYAHRAVDQYNLMQSHASCQVKTDLRWQDNYNNHLFACRHAPALLIKAEEAARDQHLRSCGGLTPEPAPQGTAIAPPSPTPPGPDSGPPPGVPASTRPTTACKVDLPPSFGLAYGTYGTDGEISAGVLRYQDTKKHEPKTFQVLRPTYYAEQQKCGTAPAATTGPWVSRGTAGQTDMYFLLNANKTVQAWPLPHVRFEQLMAPPKP